MTIINHTHRFLFVHVPKTAGTSVKRFLNGYAMPGDICIAVKSDAEAAKANVGLAIQKHSTAAQIRKKLGPDTYSQYFRFAVARNPFGRAVSIYHFLKYNFRSWPKSEVMDSFGSFEEFVMSDFFESRGPGGIFRPQANWLCDRQGRLLVDKVCQFECLERDLADVLQRLSLKQPSTPMAKRNESGGDIYRTISGLQSRSILDRIRERYDRDFRLLGFSPDYEGAILAAPPPQTSAQRSAEHA